MTFQDILFDSRTHTVLKFILHTNFPGNYDFNNYHRCTFSLRLGRPSPPHLQHPPPIQTDRPASSCPPTGKNGKSPKVKKNKQNAGGNLSALDSPSLSNLENPRVVEKNWISVSYETHWEDVNDFGSSTFGSERPVVLTRSSSNNPFGSSLCYGVQDIIFEVMSNDHIASVTLYQSEE